MTAPAFDYCEHHRIGDTCPDCAIAAVRARGGYVPEPVGIEPRPDPELAGEDVMVELGDDRYVRVNAGDELPAELAARPRHSASGEQKRRRR